MTQIQFRPQNAPLLLAAQAGNVSGVGRTVGYGSLSRFSREYRRQFGVAPRRAPSGSVNWSEAVWE